MLQISDDKGHPLQYGERSVEATLSAENTWSESLKPRGLFIGTWAGTYSAKITVRRRRTSASPWVTIATFDSADARIFEEYEDGPQWQIGIATGDYTSGSVEVSLTQ